MKRSLYMCLLVGIVLYAAEDPVVHSVPLVPQLALLKSDIPRLQRLGGIIVADTAFTSFVHTIRKRFIYSRLTSDTLSLYRLLLDYRCSDGDDISTSVTKARKAEHIVSYLDKAHRLSGSPTFFIPLIIGASIYYYADSSLQQYEQKKSGTSEILDQWRQAFTLDRSFSYVTLMTCVLKPHYVIQAIRSLAMQGVGRFTHIAEVIPSALNFPMVGKVLDAGVLCRALYLYDDELHDRWTTYVLRHSNELMEILDEQLTHGSADGVHPEIKHFVDKGHAHHGLLPLHEVRSWSYVQTKAHWSLVSFMKHAYGWLKEVPPHLITYVLKKAF